MSDFDGHVLRGPRVAPSNDPKTGAPRGGVDFDVKRPYAQSESEDDLGFVFGFSDRFISLWGADNATHMSVDQYNAAQIVGQKDQRTEHLVFAANTANIAASPVDGEPVTTGSVVVPFTGKLRVENEFSRIISALEQAAESGLTPPDFYDDEDLQSSMELLKGVLAFENDSDMVSGEGTDFVSQLSEGSLLLLKEETVDGDNRYVLQVAEVIDVDNLRLTAPFEQKGEAPEFFTGAVKVFKPALGSAKLVLTDDGNRQITGINYIKVRRGNVEQVKENIKTLSADSGHIQMTDPANGLVEILDHAYTRAVLRPYGLDAPSISPDRGDQVLEVSYYLAAPSFWWTRNDTRKTRFGWNAKGQKWEPYKGGKIRRVGLLEEATSQLTPRPRNLTVGDYLPGSQIPDSVAQVRLGTIPNAGSIPLGDDPEASIGYRGILVVNDAVVDDEAFDFGSMDPSPIGVIGAKNGKIHWNPSVFALYAGQVIWYAPDIFSPKSDGKVGKIRGSDIEPLFICPIPSPTERPLLRIGNRRWLEVLFADTEAQLVDIEPDSGQVGVALSTGQIKLSAADITKADMGEVTEPNPDFDPLWTGATLYYDGVAMSRIAQPLKGARKILNSFVGTHTRVPLAIPAPGIGISGVRIVGDGTGRRPDFSETIGARSYASGVKRSPRGLGDTFAFTPNRPFNNLRVYKDEDYNDKTPGINDCVINYGANEGDSLIKFNRKAVSSKARVGRPLYFQNADFTPATYAPTVRMCSRIGGPYSFRGDEVFRFVVGGEDLIVWAADSLTGGYTPDPVSYSATEVAESLNAVLSDSEYEAGEVGGQLFLTHPSGEGSIEILPGVDGEKDLSGCAALGFNPFWRTLHPQTPDIAGTAYDLNWLPDDGTCIGFKRTPFDKMGIKGIPDFRSQNRIEELFLGDITRSQHFYLRESPLEDIAGIEEGVFLEVQDGPYRRALTHMDNIYATFGDKRFQWLDSKALAFRTKTPVSTINFGVPGIIPESLHPVVGGCFKAREPDGEAGYLFYTDGEEYRFVNEGLSGTAVLTKEVGRRLTRGSKGEFNEGETLFVDSSAGMWSPDLRMGDRLKILTGKAKGSYLVKSVGENFLEVYPAFPATSDGPVSWELFSLSPLDEIDDQLLVDFVYKRFNHLPSETFLVNILSPIGDVSESWATTPPIAQVSRDLARGRDVHIRLGLHIYSEGLPVSVRWLMRYEMGDLANNALRLANGSWCDFSNHLDEDSLGSTQGADDVVGAFQLRIATLEVPWSDIVVVENDDAFSENPEGVEWSAESYLLKFSEEILATYGQATVVFEETPFSPDLIPPGSVEVNPDTGAVYFSQADIDAHSATETRAYWVSRMVTEDQTDVFLNPMLGAFMFREPLDEGQIVETSYRTTDSAGVLLTDDDGEVLPLVEEFLPLFIRAEECERIDSTTYKFNPTGRTVRQDIEPIVYVGPEMANQPGGMVQCSIDYENNLINFEYEIPESASEGGGDADSFNETPDGMRAPRGNPLRFWNLGGRKVTMTYGVLEAFGGESSYTVSAPPVWRPPFNIDGKQTAFQLLSDRTDTLHPGMLMRLGAFMFYVKTVEYDSDTDTTTVGFFPQTPSQGAGSRAPGNDVESLVTEYPVARVVDPNDPVVISETPSGEVWPNKSIAAHGFLVPLGELLAHGKTDPTPINVYFERTPQTRNEVVFYYNLTPQLFIGTILEAGGIPYTVTSLDLSDDGTKTTVGLAPPLVKGISHGEDEILVSTRPIYPPGPATYLGNNKPYLADMETDVVLWGEQDEDGQVKPGRSLAPTQEYIADPQTGDITFQYPFQDYISSDQRLTFRRIRVRVLKPKIAGGVAVLPAFELRFKHVVAPSEENGILNNALVGTYSYRAHDSFYYRSLGLMDFAGETAQNIIKEASSKSASYGSQMGGVSTKNWEQGRISVKTEQDHLYDRDRAARSFLSYFNSVCVAFEQIDEAATGKIIGDRDGKFRFWVGRGMEWTPRGFENPVTGRLNPRYAYGYAFQSYLDMGAEILVDEGDLIVSPYDYDVNGNDDLEGQFPDADLRKLMERDQFRYIKNDVDDRVLVGYEARNVANWPFFNLKITGQIKSMGDTHWMSRIFPTRANYFTTTYPGAAADPKEGDFGIYAYFKKRKGKWRSTYKDTIGSIENPVLGPINSISSVTMSPRTQRARVYRYSERGFPELDEVLFDGGTLNGDSFTAKPRPAVVATVLDFADFPVLDGKPKVEQFATYDPENGVPDLNTGSWEDHTPPWSEGLKLMFGKPDGEFILPKYNQSIEFAGEDVYRDLIVGEIIKGCVMTFGYRDKDNKLKIVQNGDMIIDEAGENGPEKIVLQKSDTLTISLGAGVIQGLNQDDVSLADLNTYSAMLPDYNVGKDVSVLSSGRIRDITLPKWSDPFIGLHEMMGQKRINPNQRIQGEVHFFNRSVTPLFIPALLGNARDDDGDYTLPYMKASNTELTRLREAMGAVYEILMTDGQAGVATHTPEWLSVYPDEILDFCSPAASEGLRLFSSVQPVADKGSYSAGTGVGDLREGDLMIVEASRVGEEATRGIEGIHSVGSIEVRENGGNKYSVVGMPRFVTQTKLGDAIDYRIENVIAIHGSFTDPNPYCFEGVRVDERVLVGNDPVQPWVGGYTLTRFEFEVLDWAVDDGSATDGVPYGSGFLDYSDVTSESTGGLNDILAKAEIDTRIDLTILQRPKVSVDDDGVPFFEPSADDGDGSPQTTLTITKVVMGTKDALVDQGAGDPHVFELKVNGVVVGRTERVWFYTDDALAGSVLMVETEHPDDPAVADPTSPSYDPEKMGQWFPWANYQDAAFNAERYVRVIDPDPLMEDDGVTPSDPSDLDYVRANVWISERRYTNLTNVEGQYASPEFGDGKALEEFHVSLSVVSGANSYIDTDRLTFVSPVDARRAFPRLVVDPEDPESLIPPQHPISELEKRISLNVSKINVLVWDDGALEADGSPKWADHEYVSETSNCNDKAHVNGNQDFTFLRRHAWEDDRTEGLTEEGVGYWSEGVGKLKVCGFEGHGNQPIAFADGQNMMASAIPSSDLAPVTGTVLSPVVSQGAMMVYREADGENPFPETALKPHVVSPLFANYNSEDHGVATVDPMNSEDVSFDCSKVVPGDVLYISASHDGSASSKVGSHLVRYALPPAGDSNETPAGENSDGEVLAEAPVRPVTAMEEVVSVGTSGALDLRLPIITTLSEQESGELRLWVSNMAENENFPTTTKTGWKDTGYLYIIMNMVKSSLEGEAWTSSVLRVAYTDIVASMTNGIHYFVLDPSDMADANGDPFVDDDGVALDADALKANLLSIGSIIQGKKITGARYFSVNIKHTEVTERDERLVGYNHNTLSYPQDDLVAAGETAWCSDQAVYGFVSIGIDNERMEQWTRDGLAVSFNANHSGAFQDEDSGDLIGSRIEPAEAPSDTEPANTILVGKATPATLGEFASDINAPVYDNIPDYIDLSGLDLSHVNENNADEGALDCLLPGTEFTLGLWMEAGIFLEPNFPRSTFDLKRNKRSLVTGLSDLIDDGNTLDADEVGERRSIDHIESEDADKKPYTEHVTFTVRRIRRFHNVLFGLAESMSALRFAYETRRGVVESYTPGKAYHVVYLENHTTQLGVIDDEDVNVNPGDILRVIDPETGVMKGWGEIQSLYLGAIRISPPGFIGEAPEAGDPVEIYLKQAPVPHEQSNEELLELATDRVLLTRTATLTDDAGEGSGYPASGGIVTWNTADAGEGASKPEIYEASINYLSDTNAGLDDGQINFLNEGIQPDDYIIIDPAGELTGPAGEQPDIVEYGMRPFGDRGCETTQPNFKAGGPSETDDNRGYYKIEEVEATRIKVDPSRSGRSEFIGSSGVGPDLSNALHGGTPSYETRFAVYPTVHGSELTNSAAAGMPPNGEEGQGVLRPTAFAGEDPSAPDGVGDTIPNSFEGNPFSVGPFSYRVIRPTGLLSDDAIELILYHRERILSLMENFGGAMKGDKQGSYWDFKFERHAYDLGKPTIPDTGLGVPRNDFLYGLAGQFQYAPFVNDSDCLSILDRRVTLEDSFLDTEHPPSEPPDPFFTAFTSEDEWGLPMLLQRIEEVLDRSDRIRQKRLAWLYLRTTRTDGTLTQIKNWRATLVERLRERERMRMLKESMGD